MSFSFSYILLRTLVISWHIVASYPPARACLSVSWLALLSLLKATSSLASWWCSPAAVLSHSAAIYVALFSQFQFLCHDGLRYPCSIPQLAPSREFIQLPNRYPHHLYYSLMLRNYDKWLIHTIKSSLYSSSCSNVLELLTLLRYSSLNVLQHVLIHNNQDNRKYWLFWYMDTSQSCIRAPQSLWLTKHSVDCSYLLHNTCVYDTA
jgi:hypothetical protein